MRKVAEKKLPELETKLKDSIKDWYFSPLRFIVLADVEKPKLNTPAGSVFCAQGEQE